MRYSDPYLDKNAADSVLEEWDDVCKELGVTHFLIFGTCLGFVRDGGYIRGDNDIDVGILGSLDNVKKRLVERGFVASMKDCAGNEHFFKQGILLDIWFDHKDSLFMKSFDKVTYNGRVYDVPHPVEKYLEEVYPVSKYKVDWRSPLNKEWLSFVKVNEFRGIRIGAEVGVWAGKHALRIWQELPLLHLYLIDPYKKYEGNLDYPPEEGFKAKKTAKELLKPFSDKIIWIFKKFEECSSEDIPELLDCIYIDGNHTYEYVKEDIRLAAIFVKEGGIIGGHDYQMDGVKKAVDEYGKQYNLEIFLNDLLARNGRDWYFINEKGNK